VQTASFVRLFGVASLLLFAAAAQAGPAASAVPAHAPAGKPRTAPSQIPIVSNAISGWRVQRPGDSTTRAARLTTVSVAWQTIAGSSWIAAAKRAGTKDKAGGLYTYTYTFCQAVPSLGTPVISLAVLVDNAFDARLNGNSFDPTPFLDYGSDTPFEVPQTVSTSSFFSQSGPNELEIVVENQASTPTGLDVLGYVQGVAASC
jgi:hypothetical protein